FATVAGHTTEGSHEAPFGLPGRCQMAPPVWRVNATTAGVWGDPSRSSIVGAQSRTNRRSDLRRGGTTAKIRAMERRIRRDALDRSHQPMGGGLLSEMFQHHRATPKCADRIGDTLAG